MEGIWLVIVGALISLIVTMLTQRQTHVQATDREQKATRCDYYRYRGPCRLCRPVASEAFAPTSAALAALVA